MEGFKDLSGLPRIQGAIDVAQIHIHKSRIQTSVVEYYSYKSKAYNMQLYTIIDHKKWFLDVFVGLPSLVNDVWVL
jgi:hypothetical protein